MRDVCAAPLLGTDPTDVQGPAGAAARAARRVPRLGGAVEPGHLARWRSPAGTSSASRLDAPIHQLLGAASRPLRAVRHRHDDVRGGRRLPRALLRPGPRARLHGDQGPSRPDRRGGRRHGRRRPRPRRVPSRDRRRLVLVPRRPDGAGGRRSARAAAHPVLRGAGAADAGRRPGLVGGPQPDPRSRSGSGSTPPVQFDHLARSGAAHVFQPDVSICGGVLACMEVAALARRRGIDVYPHVGGPTIIGLAANLHWAVAADVPLMEYDIDPYQPLVTEVGGPPIGLDDIAGGELAPPTGPGLGRRPARRRRRAVPVRPRRHVRRGVPRARERGRSQAVTVTPGIELRRAAQGVPLGRRDSRGGRAGRPRRRRRAA